MYIKFLIITERLHSDGYLRPLSIEDLPPDVDTLPNLNQALGAPGGADEDQ